MKSPSGFGRVIVLSGPPGAGKSTVAGILTREYAPSVHLRGDDFWHCIVNGRIPAYLPEANEQNDTVLGVMARAAAGYAAGGYHVLCDGVIGPWFIDLFSKATAEADVPLHYIILRPSLRSALKRAAGRGDDALTDAGPVRLMHRQFSALDDPWESHVLDSTELTPTETAERIAAGLHAGRY